MNSKVRRLLQVLSLVVVIVIAPACSGQPTPLAQPQGDFAIALPRIVIDIDKDGVPSVGGISADVLKTITFGYFDPSILRVPQVYVDWFTRTNVQHFEVVYKDDGLYLFVNGKPLPHIGWSSESFDNTGQVVEMVNKTGMMNPAYVSMIKLALPFVQRIGANVAFRFPRADSATEIPFADPSAMTAAATASTVSTVATARVNIVYGSNGVPSIMNVSSRDLGNAIGYDLSIMELTPAMLDQVKTTGIQHITLHSTKDGVLVWVNDKPLPNVSWTPDNLKNGVDVFSQLYNPVDPQLMKALEQLVPALSQTDVEVVLKFPVADGVQPIPVPKP